MESEFIAVARQILKETGIALRPKDIWRLGYEKGLFSTRIAGATPWQTLKSKLSVHVRKSGNESEFIRTRPGYFFLRNSVASPGEIYQAPPLRPPTPRERVLCVSCKRLEEVGRFQGITKTWYRSLTHLLNSESVEYIDRRAAELADGWKQIVTYILVTRPGQLLGFKRGSFNWAEADLRGCHCVGFGGHVTELDQDLFDTEWKGIYRSAARELAEELRLPKSDQSKIISPSGLKIVGLLNDDSSDAGRRHLAVVMHYEVSDPGAWDAPQRGEKSITQLRWINLSDSRFDLNRFEYWSQLCLRTFFSDYAQRQSTYIVRRVGPLSPPHTLCVLGQIGSGKTEASSVLKELFGYTEINSGRVLAEVLGVPPVPHTSRREFQSLARSFISRPSGPTELATAIARKISMLNVDRILVDGIRQEATLRELKRLTGSSRLGVIYIHTAPDLALAFYSRRSGIPVSMDEFFSVRNSPVELEVSRMISLADAVVYNWESRPRYRATICELLSNLGIYKRRSHDDGI